jgi:hypothetical protein
MDELPFPVFGVDPIPYFTFLLQIPILIGTKTSLFLLPRAAVHWDQWEYYNQRSTLHGVIDIQPPSGLLVLNGKIFKSNVE